MSQNMNSRTNSFKSLHWMWGASMFVFFPSEKSIVAI